MRALRWRGEGEIERGRERKRKRVWRTKSQSLCSAHAGCHSLSIYLEHPKFTRLKPLSATIQSNTAFDSTLATVEYY